MWILIAFLNPTFHAISNVLDNYLTNRLFDRKTTIIFYATLLNVVFLPFLLFFTGLPDLPTGHSLWLLLCLALINVLYMYPYYKALEQDDTSKVVALFSLGQLFVPILAYFIVGEILLPIQYVGVGGIIIASIALSTQKGVKFKMNASFWWMILCTVILSFEYVIYKLLFASVNWITGFTWPIVFSFLIAVSFLFINSTRKNIISNWVTFKKQSHIFATEELTTFIGIAAGTYAISNAPVTIVKSIMSTEPVFVLILALLFGASFPKVFKEKVDSHSIRRKLLLFIVIGIGLMLALGPDL